MTRCPACLRIVTTTPHLTADKACDGVTFAGAVDGFVPVPNNCEVDFSSSEPVIRPVFGEFTILDPDAEPAPEKDSP